MVGGVLPLVEWLTRGNVRLRENGVSYEVREGMVVRGWGRCRGIDLRQGRTSLDPSRFMCWAEGVWVKLKKDLVRGIWA